MARSGETNGACPSAYHARPRSPGRRARVFRRVHVLRLPSTKAGHGEFKETSIKAHFIVGLDGEDEEREVGRQLKTLVCSCLLPLDCCGAAVARWAACFPILLAPVFDSVVRRSDDFRCNAGCEAPSISYFNGMATHRNLACFLPSPRADGGAMVGGRESGAGASAGEVIIPLDWAEVAEEISRASSPPPVVFICGPKNSGKSTFSRYLLNVSLPSLKKFKRKARESRIPGYRCGPTGVLVSGMSLAHSHLMNPCNRATERCFFFGDVSSKSDPKAYLDCTFNFILVRKDACRMRDQRLFDYFKQCFPSNLNILTNKELAHALAAIAPYVVPFAKIKVVHLHCQVPSSEIFHSLNATIVGLAVSSDVPAKSRSDTPWCVGLGIVRAIDAVRGLLYVITPVPFGTLQKVDLLLQGFIEIPTGLLQDVLQIVL
ncbi:Pre-mRNA cleavage complex II protein Clp1 [Musa troglodytarum]|uniref:Pre-mRNA cleavage complex II protein Clp1 n=1 Tax=Musa troglodytarum TaxID=320322 RepID=A0A9E7GKJ6_9LILI|nr:Pre-mRNA cleavage complex II protein Clp1 [Musa troglodytarum]